MYELREDVGRDTSVVVTPTVARISSKLGTGFFHLQREGGVHSAAGNCVHMMRHRRCHSDDTAVEGTGARAGLAMSAPMRSLAQSRQYLNSNKADRETEPVRNTVSDCRALNHSIRECNRE